MIIKFLFDFICNHLLSVQRGSLTPPRRDRRSPRLLSRIERLQSEIRNILVDASPKTMREHIRHRARRDNSSTSGRNDSLMVVSLVRTV